MTARNAWQHRWSRTLSLALQVAVCHFTLTQAACLGQSPAWLDRSLRPHAYQELEESEQAKAILRCATSSQLIEALDDLVRQDQLWMLGNNDLPGASVMISGWRWEATGSKGQHIVVAIEGSRMIAIYESKYRGVEVSQAYYDFQAGKRVQQDMAAMSAKHLAQKSPEFFKIYFRYAGPTQEIFNFNSLPKPSWQTW